MRVEQAGATKKRPLWATVIVPILMLALSVFCLGRLHQIRSSPGQHAELIPTLDKLLLGETTALACERGYVMTGNKNYITNFRGTVETTARELELVPTLAPNLGPIQAGARQASLSFQALSADLALTIEIRTKRGPAKAFSRDGHAREEMLMRTFATDVIAMKDEAEKAKGQAENGARWTIVGWAGGMVVLGMVAFLGLARRR